MNNKLFYELEGELMNLKEDLIDYDKELTIKEFLDIGFNNSYITFENFGKTFDLGYKFENEYCGSDFSLNKKQLNCKIRMCDYDTDSEGYTIIYVELVNESDKKYFVKEGECL